MKAFLLVLALASYAQADALPEAQHRVADLREGSRLLIQLNDSALLDERQHEWIRGDQKDGLRCRLEIQSHFDRAQAAQAGTVVYTVTQNNPNDSVGDEGEVRDQFTLWLTTENKDLPYLSLDCFRIYQRSKVGSSPLTLASVTALLGQPGLFQAPLLPRDFSRTVADFAPVFSPASRVKLLQPLHFRGVKNESGVLLTVPYFQFGRIVEKLNPAAPHCSAMVHSPELDGRSFDTTVPAGMDFRFRYLSGLTASRESGETQLVIVGLAQVGGALELDVQCASAGHFFQDFGELRSQLDSILKMSF